MTATAAPRPDRSRGGELLRRRRRRADVPAARRRVLRGDRRGPGAAPDVPRGSGAGGRPDAMFLIQYWGGPSTYSEQRGHPRLRMRHAPFRVGAPSGTPGCGTCARRSSRSGCRSRTTRRSGTTWSGRRIHGQRRGRDPERAPPGDRRILGGHTSLIGLNTLHFQELPDASPPVRRRRPARPRRVTGAVPAAADVAQSKVVSADPVDFTPHVLNGTVWAVAVVGDTVVVGGTFHKVANSTRTRTYNRKNIFAYGLNDGAVRPFAPVVDGSVFALTPGPRTRCTRRPFRTVGGVAQRGLARVPWPPARGSARSGRRSTGVTSAR